MGLAAGRLSKFKAKLKNPVTIALIVVLTVVSVYLAAKALKPRLQLISPRQGPLAESVYGVGTVTPRRVYQIKTSVPGILKKLFVAEGQIVKTGDALLQFDEGAFFKAPFDGTITALPFQEGTLIAPQVSALTLTHLQDLYLEVSLEQQSALRIRPGQNIIATFESLRGERFTGKVESIYPRDNQFIVRIKSQTLPPSILPGMTSDVSIEIARHENVLAIPLSALSSGKILRVREGKKVKIDVKVGAIDSEWAEVLEGDITVNDQIIVKRK